MTRDNGDEIYVLKEDAPQWVSDWVFECHKGSLVNDFAYKLCAYVYFHFQDCENVDDAIECLNLVWYNGELADAAMFLNSNFDPYESSDDIFYLLNQMAEIAAMECAQSLCEYLAIENDTKREAT